MTNSESFGMWVKRRRKELDLTQERLAGLVGCATVTIKKLERGQYRPSRQMLTLLARELQISSEAEAEFLRRGRLALPALVPGNPYKGLLPFEEEDAALFFGREVLVERLACQLADASLGGRCLVITGPSGCGKSSLVRAGLVPELRRRHSPRATDWVITYLAFGSDPLQDLVLALQRLTAQSVTELRTALEHNPEGLRDLIRRNFSATSEIVPLLIIDPLETLFTPLVVEPVRSHLVDLLTNALTDQQGCLWMVCTLRADYYDRPLRYPGLARLIQAGTEVVIPMSAEEMTRSICMPAEAIGVMVEPELLATIAVEMHDRIEALPLLQYTLHEVFEQHSGSVLRLDDYRAIGGIVGALEQRAELIFHSLDQQDQILARQIFLRLITVSDHGTDTRRCLLLSDLAFESDGSARIMPIIEQFTRYRILTIDFDFVAGVQTVELAHEALIDAWRRLRGWVETNREQMRTQRRLAAATAEWQAVGLEQDFLPGGTLLLQFEALANTNDVKLTANERTFLEAAIQLRDAAAAAAEDRHKRELALARASAQSERRAARRLRWLVLGLLIFLVVAIVLSGFALHQQQVAETNFHRAEAQRLATEAIMLYQRGIQHELVALLSIASLRLHHTVQGEQALDLAMTLNYPRHLLDGHERFVSALAVSADGKLVFSADHAGRIRIWDSASGDLAGVLGARRSPILAMVLLDDQQTIITGAEDGVIQVLALDGTIGRTWHGHIGRVRSLAVLDSGQLLSAGDDGMVRLWTLDDAQLVDGFAADLGPLVGVFPLPNSDEVLIVAQSGALLSWQPFRGVHTLLEPAFAPVTTVALSQDGLMLALGFSDGSIVVTDRIDGTRRIFALSERPLLSLAFASNGQQLAVGSADTIVRVIKLADGTVTHHFAGSIVPVEALEFTPNGKALLTSSGSSIQIWSLADPSPFRPLQAHIGSVTSVAILSSEQLAISGGADGYVKWWDLSRGQLVGSQQAHSDAVNRLIISPNGLNRGFRWS